MPDSATQATFGYLDRHFDEQMEQTTRFVRMPSNSVMEGLNPEVFRTADQLELHLRRLGCERVEQMHHENGYPTIYAEMRSSKPDAKWLLVSCLYDVVPWDEDDWVVDPLDMTVVEPERIGLPKSVGTVVAGRGTRNQKGPLLAFLQAVTALRETEGDLPINLMFALEGEEEIASPHLRDFRDKYLPELSRAEAAYLANPIEDANGRMLLITGLRGLISLELKIRGGDWGGPADRSLFATDVAYVDNPAWRLVWALSTLKDPATDRILVDGIYGTARPWTDEEQAAFEVARSEFDEEAQKKLLGIRRFRCGMPGVEGLDAIMTQPLMNIDGIVAGYTGGGVKTSFPKSATAKMDIRLLPGMEWRNVVEALRRHLDARGFAEVEIDVKGGYNTGFTPSSAPISRAARAAGEAHGYETRLWPLYFASNPMATWNEPPLELPIVSAGIGFGGWPHMGNEFFTMRGLHEYPKWVVTFLKGFAAEVA